MCAGGDGLQGTVPAGTGAPSVHERWYYTAHDWFLYGMAKGQEGPQLLGMFSGKSAMGTAFCHRMQWHRLPHQACDVCERRAGAPQPCATPWKDLLHKSGSLSAVTTAKVQLLQCLPAGGRSAQKRKVGREG